MNGRAYLSSPRRSIIYSERPSLAALASSPSLAYSASMKEKGWIIACDDADSIERHYDSRYKPQM
jgi:hypothetical protein